MKNLLSLSLILCAALACTPDDGRQSDFIPSSSHDAGTDAGDHSGGLACADILACASACESCSATCEQSGSVEGRALFETLQHCLRLVCPGPDGGVCSTGSSGTCASCIAEAESSGCHNQFAACTADQPAPDGGQNSTDGGPRDGGQNTTDGGQSTQPRTIGANCQNTGAVEQSNCDSGLFCLGLSVENSGLTVCSKDCASDAQCGSGNRCWSGICWESCVSGGTASCRQPAFNCQPFASATDGICLPNCDSQRVSFCTEFFGYPFTSCDRAGSSAGYGSCGADGDTCSATIACGSGMSCYHLPSPSTTAVCVNDCTATPDATCSSNADCRSDLCLNGHCAVCPEGFNCSSSSRTCEIVHVSTYNSCAFSAQCPAGNTCINLGQGRGQCLPSCTADSQCPAASGTAHPRCGVSLQNGTSVCDLDCSAPGSTCPVGLTCGTVAQLGSFCLPTN